MAGKRGDHEIEAIGAGSVRCAGDDTHVDVSRAKGISGRAGPPRNPRVASARLPDLRERTRQFGDGGAADIDSRVAPRFHPARRIAVPFRAGTKAGDEADLTVDDDCLSMIPRHPAERAVEPGAIEYADLGPRFGKPRWQCTDMARTQPVIDDANVDPGA